MSEIETINDCMVGVMGSGEIMISFPPVGPIDRDKALRLAAWLSVVADPTGERFDEIRAAAVRST